jgi:hypothetical protein
VPLRARGPLLQDTLINKNCNGSCDSIWSASAKEQLFGPSENVATVNPNGCFAHWYAKQKPAKRATIDFASLLTKALHGYGEMNMDDHNLGKFGEQWEAVEDLPSTNPVRQKVAQRLVRYAFTEDRDLLGDGNSKRWGCWFSFCRGYWVSGEHCRHCWVCKESMDWRVAL